MSLSFCFLLILLGLFFQYRNDKGKANGLLACGIGIMAFIGSGVLPAVLLPTTQVSNRLSDVVWQDRNSIVLLGAGTDSGREAGGPGVPFFAYGRIVGGATAYFDCEAHEKDCNIVVSGGDPQHHGMTEAFVYARKLSALGVPESSIVLEPKSLNTYQNAAFSTQVVPKDRQIVVVTSGIHLKRSLLLFGHFRGGIEGVASDRLEPSLGIFQAGYNFFLTDAILHEQIGMAQFFVYNALGLNARPSSGHDAARG